MSHLQLVLGTKVPPAVVLTFIGKRRQWVGFGSGCTLTPQLVKMQRCVKWGTSRFF